MNMHERYDYLSSRARHAAAVVFELEKKMHGEVPGTDAKEVFQGGIEFCQAAALPGKPKSIWSVWRELNELDLAVRIAQPGSADYCIGVLQKMIENRDSSFSADVLGGVHEYFLAWYLAISIYRRKFPREEI